MLRIEQLSKKISSHFALQQINATIATAQKVALVGYSGAGKSTLLKLIAGQIQADEGSMYWQNHKIKGPSEQLLPGHPAIAYVAQQRQLHPHYTVKELLYYKSVLTENELEEVISLCHLQHLLHQKTQYLSGGEVQRVALCMALQQKPQLLLLDEPFANLDAFHSFQLKQLLQQVWEKYNTTCLLTSHDTSHVLGWANEIWIMKDGQILAKNNPKQLYYHPANDYEATLFGLYNKLTSQQMQQYFNYSTQQSTVYIRPEQIVVKPHKKGKAKIIHIEFFGSYSLLHIQVKGGFILWVSVQDNTLQKEDKVDIIYSAV